MTISPAVYPQAQRPQPRDQPKPARPFIKWAGGKGQLLAQFEAFFPRALKRGEITRVIEPFVGSGAVFLHLAQHYPVREVFVNDTNVEITRTYLVLQHAADQLIDRLWRLQSRYLALEESARRAFYYDVRTRYNAQRIAPELTDELPAPETGQRIPDLWIERAGWTIFLNKTCFNGLFRVNRKGEFNVPFGRYARPTICDAQNLQAVARILQQATILSGDYSAVEKWVDDRTFIYFDPPYRPLSATATFTSYAPGGFGEADQIRLARFFRHLHQNTAALLMLSNSDPANIDPADNFFDTEYGGFNIARVEAGRMINAKHERRGKITELLITNY